MSYNIQIQISPKIQSYSETSKIVIIWKCELLLYYYFFNTHYFSGKKEVEVNQIHLHLYRQAKDRILNERQT
jgi:hypothetical protein